MIDRSDGNDRLQVPTVDELVWRRASEHSDPLQRSDPHRLGLVIEGGGMRGVVAGGMVNGLEELGLRPVFDVVFGTSAGALAGAYFLAGQARLGTSIYYDELIDGRFISFKRVVTRSGPLVNLDFLIDHVMVNLKPLDWQELFDSGVPLRPVAISLPSFESHAMGPFTEEHELRAALRASARIPWAAGPPVDIEGIDYLDGAVSDPIPFQKAVGDGCSHVLVLQTRPDVELRKQMPTIQRILLSRKYDAIAPGLAQAHVDKPAHYAAEVELLRRASADPASPPQVLVLRPSGQSKVKQLEQDRSRLLAGAMSGFAAVIEGLTGHSHQYFETFQSFTRHSLT